jgi:hypothetical protein
MKDQQIKTDEPIFKKRTSVSVEEIMAAGGPTIFGFKSGKTNDTMIRALENVPDAEPFTEEEFMDLMKQLQDTK